MIGTIPHKDYLLGKLKNPGEAAATSIPSPRMGNPIPSQGHPKRRQAQGGIGKLAENTKLSRTSLYKTLSPAGNPELGTLELILAAFGIRIGFFPIPAKGPRSARPGA